MRFDVFCAVCGGPVRQLSTIGSTAPEALSRRRARVARRRETQEFNGFFAAGSESEDDSENSSEGAQDDEDHVEAGSDRDWYSDDEDHSYDPDLVSEESLRWLGDYSMESPTITPGLTEMLGKHLAESRAAFELQRDDFSFRESREPQIQEPFTRFPSEILHRIFLFLSGDDVLNTLKASWSALRATGSNAFWRWYLERSMPWMTDLLPVLDERQQPGRDFELSYKTVCMWLNKTTTPCYGSDGPFLSLANRRRIWGVCEQLAAYYFRRLREQPLTEPHRSITEHTICRHMALISNDQPSLDDPWPLKTTLFVHSIDEFICRPVILEAYWRNSRHLVGFSAVNSVLIRGTELDQLLFFLDQADPNTPATTPPAIAGLDLPPFILFFLSLSVSFSPVFTVPVAAATAAAHVLAPDNKNNNNDDDRHLQTVRTLDFDAKVPVSEYCALDLGPAHMIPHEVLIWATSADKIALPRRLTFYLGPSRPIPGLGLGPGPGGHHCKVEGPAVKVPAILHGLRSEVLLNSRSREHLIGLRGNIGAWEGRAAALKTWPYDWLVTLDIDGRGGKWINGIAISESLNEEGDDDAISFMLKTNRGSEVRISGGLGAGESQRWTSRRAPQGETIVGLVAGFTGKTNRPGYGGLSSLHVLTRRLYQLQGFAVPITTHD
ncbi:hypothetical protein P885DRAFT_82176 [Corynascus similis CBS 632.67]